MEDTFNALIKFVSCKRIICVIYETISRSRDMVGAHQNINASRHLTTPLAGVAGHPCIRTVNLLTKFDVFNSTHYEDIKGETKCRKWGRYVINRLRQNLASNSIQNLAMIGKTVSTGAPKCQNLVKITVFRPTR